VVSPGRDVAAIGLIASVQLPAPHTRGSVDWQRLDDETTVRKTHAPGASGNDGKAGNGGTGMVRE
jgi:hypothetical protein